MCFPWHVNRDGMNSVLNVFGNGAPNASPLPNIEISQPLDAVLPDGNAVSPTSPMAMSEHRLRGMGGDDE
jgi:hypothetical protein